MFEVIYIAIPHQRSPFQYYDTGEELGEQDRYVAGDHDLHSILKIESLEELKAVAESFGKESHQWVEVRSLASEIHERLR